MELPGAAEAAACVLKVIRIAKAHRDTYHRTAMVENSLDMDCPPDRRLSGNADPIEVRQEFWKSRASALTNASLSLHRPCYALRMRQILAIITILRWPRAFIASGFSICRDASTGRKLPAGDRVSQPLANLSRIALIRAVFS
jgi:hypothetical protein